MARDEWTTIIRPKTGWFDLRLKETLDRVLCF